MSGWGKKGGHEALSGWAGDGYLFRLQIPDFDKRRKRSWDGWEIRPLVECMDKFCTVSASG